MTDQKETIKQWQAKYQTLKVEKEQMTAEKEEEIKELKKRIEEMSSDFA